MRPGFWMHKDAMDVFIEVLRIPYRDSKRLKMKIRWWNLGYVGKPYQITYYPKTVTIGYQDQFKWFTLNSNQMTTARKEPGYPK